ncbi:MAG: dihydropyrimidinase, partial [Rhodospirillaceae bacterium]|nr:dihydropyrimidinase [Rhodospirillaceae bacterium]
MAFDLILRGARIAGTAADTPLMDIAVQGDTIAAIEPNLAADGNEWEMSGRLVSP